MSSKGSQSLSDGGSERSGVEFDPNERLPIPLRILAENDRLRYVLETLPWATMLVVFVFLPLLAIFVWSVAIQKTLGMELGFTLENYAEFLTSFRFGTFLTTIREAVLQVGVALLVGFPIAYYTGIKKRNSKYTFPLLLLFAIPFLTSYILRTLSWIAFLGNEGLINTVLQLLGVTTGPVGWLLYSKFAVRVSLLASYLPFMIFPAWLAMNRIDDDVLRASTDLGATPLQTVRHIVIPLSLPGFVIGSVFVFVGVLGESVSPVILGGGNISLIATVIDNAVNSFRIPLASAISAVILVLAVILIVLWDAVFGLKNIGEI